MCFSWSFPPPDKVPDDPITSRISQKFKEILSTGEKDLYLNEGILLFTGAVIFTLVTLPVEFNASRRALRLLEQGGYLAADEIPGARAVLSAAAMTYVAATVTALAQLLYFALRLGLLGGRDD